jgi:ParB-like chromosome segregation protein Spo0J
MINFRQPIIVKIEDLQANDYNPNRMPDIEMDLLAQCIKSYGFLFPIITTWDSSLKKYRIIDGYHRYETLKRLGSPEVMIIDLGLNYDDAIQLTVLMNRIKGMHQVELMSDIVIKLRDLGLSKIQIAKNLGMEQEELGRLLQTKGIAESFKNHEFSKSWDIE